MIYWHGKTEELGGKPVPVPLCPPQIPHELTRARTRASAVKDRRLTTWAMVARPAAISLTCPHFGSYATMDLLYASSWLFYYMVIGKTFINRSYQRLLTVLVWIANNFCSQSCSSTSWLNTSSQSSGLWQQPNWQWHRQQLNDDTHAKCLRLNTYYLLLQTTLSQWMNLCFD
jgi:hypothetical protein